MKGYHTLIRGLAQEYKATEYKAFRPGQTHLHLACFVDIVVVPKGVDAWRSGSIMRRRAPLGAVDATPHPPTMACAIERARMPVSRESGVLRLNGHPSFAYHVARVSPPTPTGKRVKHIGEVAEWLKAAVC